MSIMECIGKTRSYAWHAREWASSGNTIERLWLSARYFPVWARRRGLGVDEWLNLELPWITFEALGYLRRNLRPSDRVFEYGCGGSTLFFSRYAGSVTSVEHNPAWHAKVVELLQSRGRKNSSVHLETPEASADGLSPDMPGSFRSHRQAGSFRRYVTAIDRYEDESFDVVFVDGRARPSCIARALSKVKPGGHLVLDNSERPEYGRGTALLNQWDKHVCGGPGPITEDFSQTTYWRRPELATAGAIA